MEKKVKIYLDKWTKENKYIYNKKKINFKLYKCYLKRKKRIKRIKISFFNKKINIWIKISKKIFLI
jgi:hypothetical protein